MKLMLVSLVIFLVRTLASEISGYEFLDDEFIENSNNRGTAFSQVIYWATIFENHLVITNGPIKIVTQEKNLNISVDPSYNDLFYIIPTDNYLLLQINPGKNFNNIPSIKIEAKDDEGEIIASTVIVIESFGELTDIVQICVFLVFLVFITSTLSLMYYSNKKIIYGRNKPDIYNF